MKINRWFLSRFRASGLRSHTRIDANDCHPPRWALIWCTLYSQKIQYLNDYLFGHFFLNTLSFELIILIETALWKRITFLNTAKLSLGFTAILENDRFRENQEVLVSTRILFIKRKSPLHFEQWKSITRTTASQYSRGG